MDDGRCRALIEGRVTRRRVCDMQRLPRSVAAWNDGSPAPDQINGCRAKSQAPRYRPEGEVSASSRAIPLLAVFRERPQKIRHARNRPGVGEEQRGANQLGVIGVDRHVIWHSFEPGPFDRHAAVAGAVGELVEQGRQDRRSRRWASRPRMPRSSVTSSIRASSWSRASRVKNPRSPARMWYGDLAAARASD